MALLLGVFAVFVALMALYMVSETSGKTESRLIDHVDSQIFSMQQAVTRIDDDLRALGRRVDAVKSLPDDLEYLRDEISAENKRLSGLMMDLKQAPGDQQPVRRSAKAAPAQTN